MKSDQCVQTRTTPLPKPDHEQFVRRLMTDFPFFVSSMWKYLRLDRYHPIGWVEQDICEWIDDRTNPQRGALAPRGFGKTTFGSCMYACYRMMQDPEIQIIVASKSANAAEKFVVPVRSWLTTVPWLRHLAPKKRARERAGRDNTKMFDVAPATPKKDPTLWATGISGQIESARAHLIIKDDIEVPENTRTVDARDKLDDQCRALANLLYPNGEIVVFGTYQHVQSVYKKLARRGYTFRSWTILAPHEDHEILNLAPKISAKIEKGELNRCSSTTAFDGDKVMPYRHDDEYINFRKSQGPTNFAMQHMLISNLDNPDLYRLKLENFIVFPCIGQTHPKEIKWGRSDSNSVSTRMDEIPSEGFSGDCWRRPIAFIGPWLPYSGTKMTVDPSGRGADHTAYAVVSHGSGRLWVQACDGLTTGHSEETFIKLSLVAREHRVNTIYVEDQFGSGMFATLLIQVLERFFLDPGEHEDYPNGWRCSVETYRSQVQKEKRIIDALEPPSATHRMVVDPEVAKNARLQTQIVMITIDRGSLDYDDEIDALAACVQQWQDVLQIDPLRAAEIAHDRQRERVLREYMKGSGYQVQEPRWFTHRFEQRRS